MGPEGDSFFAGKSITHEQINNAYFMAMESMGHLNRDCASLMRRFSARGATDVTGFGILGHAENLATAQVEEVDLILNALPILEAMDKPVDGMHDFKVTGGYSAETSGGLLIMLDSSKAKDFM